MTTTIVTWQNNTPTSEQRAECMNKIHLMTLEGKTTGQYTTTTLETTYAVTRQWVDQAAAQEWIDFITPYSPVSAVIEQS